MKSWSLIRGFKYLLISRTTRMDQIMLFFAWITASIAGMGYLAFDIIMWTTIGAAMSDSPESISITLMNMGYFMVGITAAQITCLTVSEWFFRFTAWRRVDRMRIEFATSLLKDKNFHWYVSQPPEAVHDAFVFFRDNMDKIQYGIGVGAQNSVFFVSTFFGGFIVAFVYSTQLSLILLASSPLIIVGTALAARAVEKAADFDAQTFSLAAKIATKTLRNIKTVFACQQEDEEIGVFKSVLAKSKTAILRSSILIGVGQLLAQGIAISDMGFGLWYMGGLTERGGADPPLSGADIVVVLTALIYGSLALGYANQGITSVSQSVDLMTRIDRDYIGKKFCTVQKTESKMDKQIISKSILFHNIRFGDRLIPRERIPVPLVTIARGQQVAIVSPDSFSKARVAAIICGLMDPVAGEVSRDDSCIGYVGKEHGLFVASLRENLLLGTGDKFFADEDIEGICDIVGLGKFTQYLSHGLDTIIGKADYPPMTRAQERQICLARALLRCPTLLVLDQITDGLSPEDETIIRVVLRAVRKHYDHLTIINITNDYRDLMVYDAVIVLSDKEDGIVTEFGSHTKLIELGKMYYNILKRVDPELLISLTDTLIKDEKHLTIPHLIPHISSELVSQPSRHSLRRHTAIIHRPIMVVRNSKFSWRRIMQFSKDYLSFSFPLGMLGAGLYGAVPPIVIYYLSKVAEEYDAGDPETVLHRVMGYVRMLLGLGLVMGFGCFAKEFGFGKMVEGTVRNIRCLAFEHIMRQPIDVYDDCNSPESVMSNLWSKCYYAGFVASEILSCSMELLSWFMVAVVIAFSGSPRIAAVSVSLSITFFVLYYLFYRIILKTANHDDPNVYISDSVGLIGDAMSSILTVKILRAEDEIVALYRRKSFFELNPKTALWNSFIMSLFSSIPFAVFPLIISVGFWYSGYVYVGSGLTLAGIIQATYAVGDAGEVATWLLSHMPEYVRFESEALRVFDLLDNDMSFDRGEIDDQKNVHTILIESVALANVSFSYSSYNDNQVVRDVSLTALAGECVTIFGPVRSGKSTLFNLILRYYDPQVGKILVNGNNLRDLKIEYLRSLQAIVPQNPIMFENISMMENVFYGTTLVMNSTSDDQVSRILSICGISPSDDDVGWSNDRNLCQRVAIARALLRYPKILLLDEPFAHLTISQAEKIISYIQKREEITILATSNPSSFSRDSKKIFVMDWGRIVQTGTHDQLVADTTGIYFKMN